MKAKIGWHNQGPLTVEAGTVVFFRVSDGYNNIEFESVKPVLSYTVSYNANGGTGTMASSQHEYGTAKKLTANGFSKTGYTFAGWATSENGAKVYDNEQSVINLASSNGATVTLYAIWTANMYSVTPHGNGMSNVSLTGLTIRYGATVNVSLFGTLNRNGYDFMGWALTSDATEGITSFEMPAQDVILYAVWQPWPTATSAMSATNYGDVVSYSANGVNDWKVFLNDGNNVYIIASDYVPTDGLELNENVTIESEYTIKSASSTTYGIQNWMGESAVWMKYAEGFSGSKAWGGQI